MELKPRKRGAVKAHPVFSNDNYHYNEVSRHMPLEDCQIPQLEEGI